MRRDRDGQDRQTEPGLPLNSPTPILKLLQDPRFPLNFVSPGYHSTKPLYILPELTRIYRNSVDFGGLANGNRGSCEAFQKTMLLLRASSLYSNDVSRRKTAKHPFETCILKAYGQLYRLRFKHLSIHCRNIGLDLEATNPTDT